MGRRNEGPQPRGEVLGPIGPRAWSWPVEIPISAPRAYPNPRSAAPLLPWFQDRFPLYLAPMAGMTDTTFRQLFVQAATRRDWRIMLSAFRLSSFKLQGFAR